MRLSEKLKEDYRLLFERMHDSTSKLKEVDEIVKTIIKNNDRYFAVAENLSIPWYNSLESSLNFPKYLYNGDPLTGCTVRVPEGRPAVGNPLFTCKESDVNALILQKSDQWKDWPVSGILFNKKEYNGCEYRKKYSEVLPSYLWSYSNYYISGKYVVDGKLYNTLVLKMCGEFEERKLTELKIEAKIILKYSVKYNKETVKLQSFVNSFDGIY